MKTIIENVNLISTDRILKKRSLLFEEEIEEILTLKEGEKLKENKENLQVIDGKALYLSPGFIDLHLHGRKGRDTMEGNKEALKEIATSLPATGVTSFLPTTLTMERGDIEKALDAIATLQGKELKGAEILGAHLEGPFISVEHKGAQPEQAIKKPTLEFLEDYFDVLKLVTLAPEKEGALSIINRLARKGITVSAGHTGATYEEMRKAREAGLSHLTHLFNGMAGLHHRQPGPIGAALTGDYSCELIADLIHLHPAVLELVIKSKPLEEIILVSDQMEAGGLEEGEYTLGNQQVVVDQGQARLQSGQLAGSVLELNQALKNILDVTDLTLAQAISLLTINPARILGIDDKYGKIAPGYKADLVLFDEEINIKKTIKGGSLCEL